jgi:hypothetical protein
MAGSPPRSRRYIRTGRFLFPSVARRIGVLPARGKGALPLSMIFFDEKVIIQ